MTILRLLPVILACWLLAAHFVRGGQHAILVGACVAMPALLLLRERWVPVVFQVVLLLGTIEWLRMLVVLAMARAAAGEPWGRLVLILGGVAAFTALAALPLRGGSVRQRYEGAEPS